MKGKGQGAKDDWTFTPYPFLLSPALEIAGAIRVAAIAIQLDDARALALARSAAILLPFGDGAATGFIPTNVLLIIVSHSILLHLIHLYP